MFSDPLFLRMIYSGVIMLLMFWYMLFDLQMRAGKGGGWLYFFAFFFAFDLVFFAYRFANWITS